MTPSRNSPQIAVGLAGAMGCYMAVLAIVSILVGLWLDGLLGNERRIATLICAVAGAPLNLASAIWLTRKLIARVIPQTPLTKTDPTTVEPEAGTESQ
ncbi:MAG: AtpZ/AtpI family protein [Chloroflexi bacterium CFX4]|nr:AtpZ/AtpI family protein [Chloroflexi bacterium CFX4]MDL1923092.1 AtpZ/AtpI family protein [Chloroflexi bacterium CFX3]